MEHHDAAGDLSNDGTNRYLYNADGKICAVQAPNYDGMAVITGYIYDADGNRVAKGTITSMSCDPSTTEWFRDKTSQCDIFL